MSRWLSPNFNFGFSNIFASRFFRFRKSIDQSQISQNPFVSVSLSILKNVNPKVGASFYTFSRALRVATSMPSRFQLHAISFHFTYVDGHKNPYFPSWRHWWQRAVTKRKETMRARGEWERKRERETEREGATGEGDTGHCMFVTSKFRPRTTFPKSATEKRENGREERNCRSSVL